MAETNAILTWTLVSECPIPKDVNDLLDVRRFDKLIAEAVLQAKPE